MDVQWRAARVVAIVVVGAAAAAWPGSAAAVTVQRQFQATCSTPYGGATVSIQAEANAPDSVAVGEPVPGVVVTGSGTAPSMASFGLGLIGATSIQGSVDVVGTVMAPGVDQTLTTRMVIPNTQVSASGPVTAQASGTTPGYTFPRPGTATILLDSATFHITPVTSSGTTPVGTVDGTCTLDPGYSNVLFTLKVTSPAPASTSTVPTTPSSGQQPSASPAVGLATSDPPLSASPGASTTATATVAPVRSSTSALADTPTAGESSLGPLIGVSGKARTGGGSVLVLAAVLGALAVCGSAVGGFFWFNRRRRSAGARSSE